MRVGGIIELKIDGILYKAKGSFTYNLGVPKREPVNGADGPHGYKETIQNPKCEGALTDDPSLNLKAILSFKNATGTLTLANGKIIVFRNAYYMADGDVTTEEGEIQFSMGAMSAEEVR